MTPEPLPFATPQDWSDWLARNHSSADEIWVLVHKKGSGLLSITWEESVIEALCWGWIDGQKRSADATSWLQRFTPRRKGSVWSLKNRRHVESLIAAGRMQPVGLAKVAAAQADGRWDRAYGSGAEMAVPDDFLVALASADPAAINSYKALNRQNIYAISYRISAAKRPETRAKRIADFVAMLTRGEKLY